MTNLETSLIDALQDLTASTNNKDIIGFINEAIHSLEGGYYDAAHASLTAAISVCSEDEKAVIQDLADDCVWLFNPNSA